VELVVVLRALWRHRILVVLGIVAATAVGLMVASEKRSRSEIASARVVLDTPRSQLVNAEAKGSETLGWRASLLADLMSTQAVRTRIARDMQVPADSIVVVSPDLAVPAKPTPLSELGLDAAAVTPEPYVLTVSAAAGLSTDVQLPIISIQARAPDRAGATRLANVASAILRTAPSPPENTPGVQKFVVERVGPVRARESLSPPRPLLALGAALVALGFWCCGVGLVSGLVGAWRASGRTQPAG
jgi:hypothetical protein